MICPHKKNQHVIQLFLHTISKLFKHNFFTCVYKGVICTYEYIYTEHLGCSGTNIAL